MNNADALLFVASALRNGDLSMAEQMNLCLKVQQIASRVRKREHTLSEIERDAQEDELRRFGIAAVGRH